MIQVTMTTTTTSSLLTVPWIKPSASAVAHKALQPTQGNNWWRGAREPFFFHKKGDCLPCRKYSKHTQDQGIQTTAARRTLKGKGYVGRFVGEPILIHWVLQPLPGEQVPLQFCTTAAIFGACEIFFFFRYVGLNVFKKGYVNWAAYAGRQGKVGGWDGVLFWVGQTGGRSLPLKREIVFNAKI